MAGLKFTIDAEVQKLVTLREELVKTYTAVEKFNNSGNKSKQKEIDGLKQKINNLSLEIAKLRLNLEEAGKADVLVKTVKKTTQATNEATKTFDRHTASLEEINKRVKELNKEYLSLDATQRAGAQGQALTNEIATLNAQRKLEADALDEIYTDLVPNFMRVIKMAKNIAPLIAKPKL